MHGTINKEITSACSYKDAASKDSADEFVMSPAQTARHEFLAC